MNQLLDKLNPVALLVVRVLVGYMYLLHGTSKFFEFPVSMTGGQGSVELFSIFGFAGILEIVGGVLLILGLFTRAVSFLLSGQMAYAYFFVHGGDIFFPPLNHGEAAALYSLMFLVLVFTGAGKLSLDHRLFCRKA